jgi:anthranilate phosphoribosyltransferase
LHCENCTAKNEGLRKFYMNIQQGLAKVIERQNLSTEEMVTVMNQIMSGEATPAQIGGFLVALRMKGETIDEITGAATVMRQLASGVKVDDANAVDTCGTGGDGSNLFNVSTASSFVVAAAGGKVAKHGNRSISSSTGSADVLEFAGVSLALSAEQVGRCVNEIGVGFMFAPAHHSAMKHAIGPRKELAQRTIFNMLGPLTNPAGVKNQVIGVFNAALCRPLAEVLQRLGSEHVLIVHSDDGLDEISLATETTVAELKDGQIIEYKLKPEDVGIDSQSLIGLTVESAEQSYQLIKDALGKRVTEAGNKAADIIALNAGAAIYAANIASSLEQGVEMAQDAIYSGLALGKLNELVTFTRCLAEDQA